MVYLDKKLVPAGRRPRRRPDPGAFHAAGRTVDTYTVRRVSLFPPHHHPPARPASRPDHHRRPRTPRRQVRVVARSAEEGGEGGLVNLTELGGVIEKWS